jgi:hypothetical protein
MREPDSVVADSIAGAMGEALKCVALACPWVATALIYMALNWP